MPNIKVKVIVEVDGQRVAKRKLIGQVDNAQEALFLHSRAIEMVGLLGHSLRAQVGLE